MTDFAKMIFSIKEQIEKYDPKLKIGFDGNIYITLNTNHEEVTPQIELLLEKIKKIQIGKVKIHIICNDKKLLIENKTLSFEE